MERRARWTDWANVVLGGWLCCSPWVLGYGGTAAGNALMVGPLAMLLGLWTVPEAGSRVSEGADVVLGAWLFAAPWVLGFASTAPAAAWNAWLVGTAIAVLAATGYQRIAVETRRHA